MVPFTKHRSRTHVGLSARHEARNGGDAAAEGIRTRRILHARFERVLAVTALILLVRLIGEKAKTHLPRNDKDSQRR